MGRTPRMTTRVRKPALSGRVFRRWPAGASRNHGSKRACACRVRCGKGGVSVGMRGGSPTLPLALALVRPQHASHPTSELPPLVPVLPRGHMFFWGGGRIRARIRIIVARVTTPRRRTRRNGVPSGYEGEQSRTGRAAKTSKMRGLSVIYDQIARADQS
ncbi:hypothetical protein DFH07DRAFT_817181 [Mycena maculata]|uniref:Uncharacterized protein n=1 Tax=Mycena maculata TaxID=230809 RepID=A0AAD7J9E1_9AGAR|nr:hypothetical protein DFH07DRAFT_817181 [Mycena maculata]